MQEQGVETFDSTITLVRELRGRGVRTGVVTSSRHGREILGITGTDSLFDARLDGIDIGELGLAGKPDPDMFLKCAEVELGGESLAFGGPHGRELRRTLDLRTGVLHIEALYETVGGRRTVVRTRRCASLADPHLLLQEAAATGENHWAEVLLEPALEPPQTAARHPHVERIEAASLPDAELVRYRTRASGFDVCIVSRAWREAHSMRRCIVVYTSRDAPDPRAAALEHLRSLDGKDFEALVQAHAQEWAGFWRRSDIRVAGRPSVEQALRFGSYHLRLPAGDDPRVSIGARTLTGRGYEGHVFWDTEIFMLPFYLHTEPARARTLLLYRHHTLEGARRRARELGYRGACYAWESTVTGDDVTPSRILLRSSGREIPIFTGSQQMHVTADVAYAIWRYWEATRDEDFLSGPGATILFETARFWASRMTPDGQHHHIRGVVGPDEYHHGVNDNAYTNWMARFNLEQAAGAARRFGLHEVEAQEWSGLAASLFCPGPGSDGVIEQFEGFFELGDYRLPDEERFKPPISRLFDWEKINRLKLLKQADVLMLPLLFPDAFTEEVVAANYRYYEPMTDHGSSLSPAVHAAIAARIGLLEDAEHYWKQSLWLDLSNGMDNSMLGVHAATMGGTWQALFFGFLGVRFTDDGPQIDARAGRRLPAGCESLEATLAWRGCSHPVKVERR